MAELAWNPGSLIPSSSTIPSCQSSRGLERKSPMTLRSFLGRCRIQTGIRRMDSSLPSRTRGDNEPWRKNVSKWKWQKQTNKKNPQRNKKQKTMVDDKEPKSIPESRIVRRKAGNEGKSKLMKDLTFRLWDTQGSREVWEQQRERSLCILGRQQFDLDSKSSLVIDRFCNFKLNEI